MRVGGAVRLIRLNRFVVELREARRCQERLHLSVVIDIIVGNVASKDKERKFERVADKRVLILAVELRAELEYPIRGACNRRAEKRRSRQGARRNEVRSMAAHSQSSAAAAANSALRTDRYTLQVYRQLPRRRARTGVPPACAR